jgi:hypothetical protein
MRHRPGAVKLVDGLLAKATVSIDDLMIEKLNLEVDLMDLLERIDRLTTLAEARRNTSLREIDRRRAILGEAVGRGVQEVEMDELKLIEATPTEGKDAA